MYLAYSINIIMKNKYVLLVLLSLFVYVLPVSGQKENKKKVLTGYVTDANGNPVEGAMILIDKINTNILTDNKGFYRVKVKPGAKLLTAFTLTTGSAETDISGRTSIDLSLNGILKSQPDNHVKDEKINIGYGTAERKDINSQVNRVNTTADKYASYSNIYDMLKGTVPGLQVIGKSIMVQGLGTPGNSEPLLVVDDNIVSSIDDIHPSQVKSVDVLKGASASIYGSRGANGVIIIHLKGRSEMK
jgi:TonB-dependent SusC/RagA subfamily outer membrane receptor